MMMRKQRGGEEKERKGKEWKRKEKEWGHTILRVFLAAPSRDELQRDVLYELARIEIRTLI